MCNKCTVDCVSGGHHVGRCHSKVAFRAGQINSLTAAIHSGRVVLFQLFTACYQKKVCGLFCICVDDCGLIYFTFQFMCPAFCASKHCFTFWLISRYCVSHVQIRHYHECSLNLCQFPMLSLFFRLPDRLSRNQSPVCHRSLMIAKTLLE